ncbi:MAG: sugar phosphate nucleotidyltransferase [Promethearchaeota archaeon]
MRAIILAGGEGKRLKPYTTVLPKPLMPFGETPILEIIFKQLKYYGFHKVTLALGYKAKYIRTFFANSTDLGLEIEYSYEKQNLGTAGPIRLIKNLDNNFLVLNGDILTDFNFLKFFKTHLNHDAIATVAVYTKNINIDLGVIETKKDQVINYIEKPTASYQVSMGIYAFNNRVVDFIPYNEYLDIPNLIKKLISNGETVKVHNQAECIWLDIGNITDFQHSLELFKKYKSKFLPRNS